MNKLSSQDRALLIRLASSLPAGEENRKAILAGLKMSHPLSILAAETDIIRDPKTGLSVAELWDRMKALGWSVEAESERKELARIHDRLLAQQKKKDRGLRLSSRPKDVAGLIGAKGQWGYQGKWTTWTQYDMDNENNTSYAVLRGDTVVAWVIKVEQSARATNGMSYGGHTVKWSEYTAYALDGTRINYGDKSSARVLDAVAAYLKKQAP